MGVLRSSLVNLLVGPLLSISLGTYVGSRIAHGVRSDVEWVLSELKPWWYTWRYEDRQYYPRYIELSPWEKARKEFGAPVGGIAGLALFVYYSTLGSIRRDMKAGYQDGLVDRLRFAYHSAKDSAQKEIKNVD